MITGATGCWQSRGQEMVMVMGKSVAKQGSEGL